MTTLMITPFAPERDGIANYAVQEVAALRRDGVDVEVLSPLPSAAHHHLVIGSATGMVRLLRRVDEFDEIIVQAFPDMLFGACRNRLERLAVWGLWAVLARRVPVEFRIHEIDYATITTDPATLRAATAALGSLSRRTVHTEAERRDLLAAAPGIGPVDIVDHGSRFVARTTLDRDRARAALGIHPDHTHFVSIGFVQRHKGFDRAVRAFGRLDAPEAELHVVGGIRVDHPDLLAYRDELDRLIAVTPNCHRRAGYVGDAEFDRWIVAADCVVLPYRQIWSSSVVERAALLGTQVVVTAVGGLADQAPEGSIVVGDDRELADAMASVAGVPAPTAGTDLAPDPTAIETLIRKRAGSVAADGVVRPADPLRRVAYAQIGSTDSGRPGVRQVKTVIRRVTSWLIQPTIDSVNDVRDATITALERPGTFGDDAAPGPATEDDPAG